MQKNVLIIPARGGSKRIKRKNLQLINNSSLIQMVIEKAKKAKIFSDIYVSTDDEEIKHTALEFGANIPFMRPKILSGDKVTTLSVIKHALGKIKDLSADDNVVCMYPTSVTVSELSIRAGLSMLKIEEPSIVVSIKEFPQPLHRAFHITDGFLQPFKSSALEVNTQSLEKAYFDSGQFYMGKKKVWQKRNSILGESCIPFILPKIEAFDIDDEQDLEVVRKILNET